MKLDLSEKVVLVTGGSRGIGLSIALAFGTAGARVAICSRSHQHLEAAGRKLKEDKIDHLLIPADVTHPDSAHLTIETVIEQWGKLDVLVNNAGGIRQTGTFFTLSDQDWAEALDLNVLSVVRFSREAIPHLRKSTSPRIINLSSVVARQPGAYNPHYASAKIAIVTLTKHLANILAADGILVNCISPGIVHTDGWDEYIQGKALEENRPLAEVDAAEYMRAGQSIPLGRLGHPGEIASVALFLASEAGSFITGTEIVADGGKLRGI